MVAKSVLAEETTKSAVKIGGEIRNRYEFDISYLEQFLDMQIRFVEIDGLVKVMLEIGDKATHKDIREAIPNILKWRDELQEIQSDQIAYRLFHKMLQKPTNSKEELLEFFSQMQERGKSYANLAELFNQVLGKSLIEIKKYQGKAITTEQFTQLNALTRQVNIMLSAMTIKGVDTEYALEQIVKGKPPFQNGYPVSRYKMIEVLRTWRKGKPHIRVKNALEKVKAIQEKQKG
jgi:hypothetical protein